MKLLPRLAAPVLCAALVAVGGGAFAAPVVTDPLVKLVAGAAPTAVLASAAGSFYVLNSGPGLEAVPQFDAAGDQKGAVAVPLPTSAKSSAMVQDRNGVIFVANPGAHFITQYNTTTGTVTTIGLPVADVPVALAVNVSNDIFATKDNDEVMRITSAGVKTLTFAKLDARSAPLGIVTDTVGNVYTANSGTSSVSKITSSGVLTQSFAMLAPGSRPVAITIDSKGMLFTANVSNNTISKIDSTKPAGTPPVAVFSLPVGAAPSALKVDQFDNVFIAESGLSTIGVIVPGDATANDVVEVLSTRPVSLDISTDNKLLVAGTATDSIASINLETRVTTSTIGPLTVGAAFTGTAAATGVGDMTFSSRDLPSWLKLDPATGALIGTPTVLGASSFTLQALSTTGRSDSRTVTFEVTAAPVTPTPTPTPGTGGAGQTGGTGGAGGGAGGAGSGAGGSGTGAHGTGSLASTGAGDTTGWGIAGLTGVLLGFAGLLGARLRRRLLDS